ncbi:N-acetylmuramoyl-L-alanine amidase [uncultured Metabacillus sp.]|uniref:N-acetylmuramoyl-L-alanine amidase family protein n=1 Tax=uncultured Metabacillus sp. TaxID=2860135 RepID=UPI00260428CD|nr:N-acetylmuramoyl-L-alanine amidase [uncultured Metabacillus sp.]
MTFKVAGCAGHGGNNSTPGKRDPDGIYEWNYNNKVILAFENELKKYEGVEFKRFDDRSGKTDVSLSKRVNGANAWGADVYISFHKNANTGKWGSWGGTETFQYSGSKNSERLAALVHPAQLEAYGLRNRGIKSGNHLYILKHTNMPSILLEGAFMDSTTDIKKLRDDQVLDNAGRLVAQAVAKYAGLKLKETAKPVVKPVSPTPSPKKEESVQILTGGLSPESVELVTEYFIDKNWWFEIQGAKDQNPRALSGGLQGKALEEYKAWLDAKGWYYEIIKK